MITKFKLLENKGNDKRVKILLDYLSDIWGDIFDYDQTYKYYLEDGLDSNGEFMINLYGEVDPDNYYNFKSVIDILQKHNIRWRLVLSGYIDIWLNDDDKFDLLLNDLSVLSTSNKYNL